MIYVSFFQLPFLFINVVVSSVLTYTEGKRVNIQKGLPFYQCISFDYQCIDYFNCHYIYDCACQYIDCIFIFREQVVPTR